MRSLYKVVVSILFLIFIPVQFTHADGTDRLGPPLNDSGEEITLASGTGIAIGGTGLFTQPSNLTVDVPAGATIKQVLIYWSGFSLTSLNQEKNDNNIIVKKGAVTKTISNAKKINDNLYNFHRSWNGPYWYGSTYRKDITSEGLISSGSNTLTISGFDNFTYANGAGVLVIYDDGTTPLHIDLRDGTDFAYHKKADEHRDANHPLAITDEQTFTFDAASYDRTADLSFFVSSIHDPSSGTDFRPNVIVVNVAGTETTYNDLLQGLDGGEWDSLLLPVVIPAGATSLEVRIDSKDGLSRRHLDPASFVWNTIALSIIPEEFCGDGFVQDFLGEQCDDANLDENDGCNNSCQKNDVADDEEEDDCTDYDASGLQADIDGGMNLQENIIKKALFRLKKVKKMKGYTKKVLAEAHAIQVAGWSLSWSFPSTGRQCKFNEYVCTADNENRTAILNYQEQTRLLDKLLKSVVKKGRKASGKRNWGKKYLKVGKKLLKKNIKNSNQIPGVLDSCIFPDDITEIVIPTL